MRSDHKDLGAFLMPGYCGKGIHMAKETNDEVMVTTDSTGVKIWLSEKASKRLSWILAGLCALISMPVIILAFMTI